MKSIVYTCEICGTTATKVAKDNRHEYDPYPTPPHWLEFAGYDLCSGACYDKAVARKGAVKSDWVIVVSPRDSHP